MMGRSFAVAFTSLMLFLAGTPSHAQALVGEYVATCENGRSYPLRPIAVSSAGEIVTARLYTAPRRAVHVRLVPMGLGYRYAGRGIWLDGVRAEARMNFGPHRWVGCVVQAGAARGAVSALN